MIKNLIKSKIISTYKQGGVNYVSHQVLTLGSVTSWPREQLKTEIVATSVGEMSILVVKIVMLALMGVFALFFGLLPIKVCHLLILSNKIKFDINFERKLNLENCKF